jgi:hypothetical protein
VAFTPDAEGSIVPRAAAARPAAPLATTPPPNGTDFLDGALMVLVSGDDCLLCSAGLQIGALRYYVQQLCKKAGFPEQTQRCEFIAVANRDNIKELIESGVQEVGLNTTLDELDIQLTERTTYAKKLRGELGDVMRALFASEPAAAQLIDEDSANINAKFVISFNKRRSGRVTQEQFDQVVEAVADQEDPGIYIKLRSGGRITQDSIKVTERFQFEATGTTIDHKEAWDALAEMHERLSASGLMRVEG